MRRLVLAASSTVVLAMPAAAQQAIGEWRGSISPAPGMTLRIAVRIQPALEGGGLVGTLDSLDQGAMGIALAGIAMTGDRLAFAVPAVGGRFEGKWETASKRWVGSFNQGATPMPLALAPNAAATAGPLAVPSKWTMPTADLKPLLDTLVASRPGIGATAALIDASVITVRASGTDPATLFEIGSLTKVFTAFLLADMVAKGEVELDDPAAKYLPAGTLSAHGHRPITLRDLANHYSGLPRLPANLAPTDMADPYADYDEAAMLGFLKSWTPPRAPGAMFEYSNYGAGLLGYALGRARGIPYQTLVADRILKPLGLTATRFSIGPGEAAPHGLDGKAVKPWNMAALSAAGGLRSTAGDLAKFARALIDPPAEIKPAVAMLLADRKPGSGQSRIGLGIFTRTTSAGEIAYHDGGTGGSQSSMILDIAHKRGAVVLLNSAASPPPGPLAVHLVTGRPLPSNP